MRIVIDIPEKEYEFLKANSDNPSLSWGQKVIATGTPLPEGEYIDDFCPKCGVSKYNFFTVIKGANGERTKPFGTWNYCPACGADLRQK